MALRDPGEGRKAFDIFQKRIESSPQFQIEFNKARPLPIDRSSEEVKKRVEEILGRRRVLELTFAGFDDRFFEASERIIMAAKLVPNARVIGPYPLPTRTRKWTILKGPFKHKKARDQLGLSRYQRRLKIDTTRDVADRFLEFLKENMHPVIAIQVRVHDYVPIEEYFTLSKDLEAANESETL